MLIVAKIPTDREIIGITKKPSTDSMVNSKYSLRLTYLLEMRNLSANPKPREVYISPSKMPRNRLESPKVIWK